MSPASKNSAASSDKQREVYLVDVEEEVRRRAYELYERRGKEDGHDLEDWLQAESEFAQTKTKTAAV